MVTYPHFQNLIFSFRTVSPGNDDKIAIIPFFIQISFLIRICFYSFTTSVTLINSSYLLIFLNPRATAFDFIVQKLTDDEMIKTTSFLLFIGTSSIHNTLLPQQLISFSTMVCTKSMVYSSPHTNKIIQYKSSAFFPAP